MGEIIIAPFSNSAIRDWPAGHFLTLVGLLLSRLRDCDTVIRVIGAPGQRDRANAIVRPHPADRVANDCGRAAWPEVLDRLRHAACVVGNNSGIAHVAASLGVPTVCIFGGSHQRVEWRPLGVNVTLLSRTIGCSPCYLDHDGKCKYGISCLRQIEPGEVAEAIFSAMSRVDPIGA